ncbi:hypothetical protein OMR58_22480 [Erwinia sp. INIA-01]|uniref:hypothetical protein n=1 Tax=Erwinia sp. INIA01 TaxID=2991500 RepID=UPI0022254456|nr:hypothetical protein [Erwinia sp. INIA01]MCW1877219.1 hypothetical protein [Erwinia sp. INIA01]
MAYIRTETADDVIDTVKDLRNQLHTGKVWMSAWPVLDRFLERTHEMRPVWENIARQRLSEAQCHCLVEQLAYAGKYASDEERKRLKDDHKRLIQLNEDIREHAKLMALKMRERDALLNRNDFIADTAYHIIDLTNQAAESNSRYRSYIRDPLVVLRNRYELKYWPSISDVIDVVAREQPEIVFLSEADREVVRSRGATVPDYLRIIFNHIQNVREDICRLPTGFTLSDDSLAILATVTLDLPEAVSTESVKERRNQFSKAGVRGAWPHRADAETRGDC